MQSNPPLIGRDVTAGAVAGLAPAAAPARVRQRGRLFRRSERAPGEPRLFVAYLFILPALAFFATFTLAPLLHAVVLSFYNWDGLGPKTFAGFSNYTAAAKDPAIRSTYGHVLELFAFYTILPITLGLMLTALLTRAPIRGLTFFRTVLFLPATISGVVVAQAWIWIYDEGGPLNRLLRGVGLGSLAHAWLGSFTWALPAVGVVGTWVSYGLCMVLFIAGVQRIPSSLYEAARVDGAGAVREFLAVTLPGLRGEIAVALMLTTVNALRSFDIVWNTTEGGPGGATTVPSVLMYLNGFTYNRVGYASAIAVMLALSILVVVGLIHTLSERWARI
ncbi:MAG: carbohydrate ABC transporter permease [Gaiellaceae bacterium]